MDFSNHTYRKSFEKLWTAMIVPYKRGTYEIDEDAFRKLLRYYMQDKFVNAGGALIVNPEAGEIFYLSYEEKRRLMEITAEEVNGKMMIVAGALGMTTEETVRDAVSAKELGADGLFFIPPMGLGDITRGLDLNIYPEIWTDMMDAMVDASGLPLLVHPTAGGLSAYGSGIPESQVLNICKRVPAIVGWKMTYTATGWYKVGKALRTLDPPVAILGAQGGVWHTAFLNHQFDGCVNGSLNYAMEPMVDHVLAWQSGDFEKACAIWEGGLSDIHDYVYGDFARMHIKYKIATWLRGFSPEPFMRPPQPRPMKMEVETLKGMLEALNLPVIPQDEIKLVVDQLTR